MYSFIWVLPLFLLAGVVLYDVAAQIDKACERYIEDSRAKFKRNHQRRRKTKVASHKGNRQKGALSVRDTIKANESRLKNFQAYQECPKCGRFDWHRFEDVDYGKAIWWSVIRRCGKCGHGWYQR